MRRKRIWGMILAVCMLVQPISVLAEEKEQNGYLNIREYATGEKTQIYVKAEDKVIYAQPQEIAQVCGAVVEEKAYGVDLNRKGYMVRINVEEGTATLENEIGPISRQTFPLECKVKDDEIYLPLEKTMYLLNAGWQMDGETVVVDAPKETLWNLLNDFPKLAKMRPLAEDLYGNHVYEKSFKYVLLALGDEIDYRIILSVIGERMIEKQQCEKVLYDLGKDDSKYLEGKDDIFADMETLLKIFKDGYGMLEGLGKMPEDLSGILKYMEKRNGIPFTKWDVIPEEWLTKLIKSQGSVSQTATDLDIALRLYTVIEAVHRLENWQEIYCDQLKSLADSDISYVKRAGERAEMLQDSAKRLYENSSDSEKELWHQIILQVMDVFASELFKKVPVAGKALEVYGMIVPVASAMPEISKQFDLGSDAYDADVLLDIGAMSLHNCSYVLNHVVDQQAITIEQLKEARANYMLMIRTYFHTWDRIGKVREAEGNPPSEDEIDVTKWDTVQLEMMNLQELITKSYELIIRMNESARYDSALLLNTEYTNLYNEKTEDGIVRQKIPLSLITEERMQAENEGVGNVIQGEDGSIYYWKYQKSSFEETGTLAQYQALPGMKNALIKRELSGEEKTVFEAEGAGEIAVTEEKIFYEKPIDNMAGTKICSYDRRSGDITEIENGKLKTATEEYIICSDLYEEEVYSLGISDEEKTKLADGRYLAIKDGFIYYQMAGTDRDKVTLARIKPDGSDEKELCTVGLDEEMRVGDLVGSATIAFMIFRGKDIYFSYGTYGGTALMYQGGKIARYIGEEEKVEDLTPEEWDALKAADFVVNADGTIDEEYIGEELYDTPPMAEYYTADGSVFYYAENGTPEEIITQEDYASVGEGICGQATDDTALTLKYVEKFGEKVYFFMDSGEKQIRGGAGWRYSYKLQSGAMLEKDLSTGEVTTLYTY